MKKYFYSFFIIFSLFFIGCNTTEEATEAEFSGKVYYLDANSFAVPIEGALVYTKTFFAQTTTDATGSYLLQVEPDMDEAEIVISASKVGFVDKEVTAIAKIGDISLVQDITLTKIQSDTVISPIDTLTASGDGTHIEVYGSPDPHIYIQSSGLSETTVIHFLVTDAQGIPVDANHAVTVSFSILNGPDGGEYLFPESMQTQDGYVYTILNSGTIAGAVQIDASFDVDGNTYRAIPINLAIYGGLPDEDHFSMAFERVNIAGRVHFGILDRVTAFVGDKFSNPVAPGTAVYFKTTHGIVGGSALTDEMGRASVDFLSALPLPTDPVTDPFAYVTIATYTDTMASHQIQKQGALLLSSATGPILINPTSFTYNDLNQPISFDYTVEDVNGWPLVGGTTIQVSASEGTLLGDVSMNLNDTQTVGQGTTDFSFSWAPGDSLEAPAVYIGITVNTPDEGNGYGSVGITGTKTP